MDVYDALRRQAEQRCNEICRDARRDCRQVIAWIKQLQKRLEPPVSTAAQKRRFMHDTLAELMPKDREFSLAEMMRLARDALPGRRINKDTLRSNFGYLESIGVAKRTRWHNRRVLWAVAGFDVPRTKFGVRTIVDVAAEVLRDSGPMNAVELLVTMRERGYRPDGDPRKMLGSLSDTLRRSRKFKRDGKRWGLA